MATEKKQKTFETVTDLNLEVAFINARTIKSSGKVVPVLTLKDDVGTQYCLFMHGISMEQAVAAGIARGATWTQDLAVATEPDTYTHPRTGVTEETYEARPAGECRDFVPVWTTLRAFPMIA